MKHKSRTSSFWKFIIAIVLCELTGAISGLISMTSMNPWFDTINKPSWNPPSYLFGPVWAVLYLLMGISFTLIWKSSAPIATKRIAETVFFIQLCLNFCWSILFFKLHSPALALIDILLMVVAILITIFRFASISKAAAWLLVPYILWVCFATMLNFAIWSMN